MKILFIEWASFGNADIKDAFADEGHQVVCFPFSNKDARRDAEIESDLAKKLHETVPDAVFSFNYFPLISNVCKREGLPYISWIYDSPYVMLYSYTAINPCNTIYVFDRALCREFNEAGIKTVRYLPMAANTDRLDRLDPFAANPAIRDTDSIHAVSQAFDARSSYVVPQTPGCPYLYNVSFVGSLYTCLLYTSDAADEQ